MQGRLIDNIQTVWQKFVSAQSDTMTNITSTNWLDCKDVYDGFCMLIRLTGTGKIQNFGLYASAAATGTNAVLVGSLTGSTNMTGSLVAAVGSILKPGIGRIVAAFTHSDIANTGLVNARYLGARASRATGTDDFGFLWVLRMKSGKLVLATGNDNT